MSFSVSQIEASVTSNGEMNNEWWIASYWQTAVMILSNSYFGICLQRLRESTRNLWD